MNRNALFAGGIRPHHYCLPVLKTEADRAALLEALAERQSALLPRHRQRAARAQRQGEPAAAAPASSPRTPASSCTPRSSSPPGMLPRLQGFASEYGADFYRLPRNQRHDHPGEAALGRCRHSYPFGADELVPLRAGERIGWRLQSAAQSFEIRP